MSTSADIYIDPSLAGLPQDYREIAFRGVETVLREDPVLDQFVKTWRSREGQTYDYQMPATDMMPMIGLSPVPRPNQILSIGDTKINFAVSVELYAPGSWSGGVLNLWGAVEAAIVKSKPFRPGVSGQATVQEFFCNLISQGRGLINLHPVEPAFLPVKLSEGTSNAAYQGGVGLLCGILRRPS